MKKSLRLLILIWLTCMGNMKLAASLKLSDYCSRDQTNTPCATKCARASQCGDTADTYTSLIDEEREVAVTVHNEYREKVASGNETTLPASNGGIYVVSYDKEVEFVAACHAKQCTFDHDKLRMTAVGEKMGQNIYKYSREIPRKDFIRRGIQRWYEEVSLLKGEGPSLVDKFRRFPGVGHLTAMIWGQSIYVGCAIMHYRESKGDQYQLTCNYKPSGNRLRNKIYELQAECKKNDKYPSLCGEIRPLSEDTYTPPINLSKACTIYHFFASRAVLLYSICGLVGYALM